MSQSREPLTREAIIAAAIALLVQLLSMLGMSDEWTAWVGGLCTLAVATWIVLRVRPQVTPVADPRGADGTPLVPTRKDTPDE